MTSLSRVIQPFLDENTLVQLQNEINDNNFNSVMMLVDTICSEFPNDFALQNPDFSYGFLQLLSKNPIVLKEELVNKSKLTQLVGELFKAGITQVNVKESVKIRCIDGDVHVDGAYLKLSEYFRHKLSESNTIDYSDQFNVKTITVLKNILYSGNAELVKKDPSNLLKLSQIINNSSLKSFCLTEVSKQLVKASKTKDLSDVLDLFEQQELQDFQKPLKKVIVESFFNEHGIDFQTTQSASTFLISIKNLPLLNETFPGSHIIRESVVGFFIPRNYKPFEIELFKFLPEEVKNHIKVISLNIDKPDLSILVSLCHMFPNFNFLKLKGLVNNLKFCNFIKILNENPQLKIVHVEKHDSSNGFEDLNEIDSTKFQFNQDFINELQNAQFTLNHSFKFDPLKFDDTLEEAVIDDAIQKYKTHIVNLENIPQKFSWRAQNVITRSA